MVKGVCKNCNKEKDISLSGMSKGLCHYCYKKILWKPQIVICSRCKRQMPLHAKGMCPGCYNSTFHIDKVRLHNAKRYHKIGAELYKKVVSSCVICNFNKIVDLHHLNHNKTDNSEKNLVGLCPNHHKMIHTKNYQKEVFNILKEKGYNVPEASYSDGFFKDSMRSRQ